ncbi:hypothetical protein A1O1_01761 [Capronia coronata CBS 617.96]|uniref:Folliculin-interacting protein N-terminal domain-containing protein n=1 Tax=Capronia coronata CBS 617.96 TaxID=1182541 RepID=W9ZFV9_9EURO|nr:uncharacterized protein A1O1_01761 [Capronia coronata CBS 617.96]EXJ93369.1 hypothetical protein A1O1_01761 [Capronia coronata CBS 617.96]
MLGRLIQGYGRSGQLESATDESHTRALLWPEIHSDARPQSVSPPTTPLGSPSFRVSPFDDRVGLELNETRDLRLIIAQDAFGTNDRPMVLLDTHNLEPGASSPGPGPQKMGGPLYPGETGGRSIPGAPVHSHVRNRSSTISGASASWSRPFKEPESTDHLSNILDCMFGVSSATKLGSSTKMHFLPGDRSSPTDLGPRPPSNATSPAIARVPLLRARTSTHAANAQRQASSSKEADVESRDAILITRMFPVSLHDSQDDLRQHRDSSAGGNADPASPASLGREQQESPSLQSKKPKLVEKKTPVYAAALLCYLPRSGDQRPGTSAARPSSRASTMASSTPNSYGSDSLSSWTILNSIPDHLLSSDTSAQLTDQGIETIVKNWNVILRSLAVVERLARVEVGKLLQEVNLAMISSAAKAPKGPSEQRTNQRNVYIRSSNVLARNATLQQVAKHALWRISYALRIPRVVTGFGLDYGGPWLDEARYLVRACGNKQHNFFLFNLLTAFLGNHTEWLERLGPEWYRKQFQALNQRRSRPCNLASRTVIVCDSRSMARRLIFLLASFLPLSHNVDPTARLGSGFLSPLSTPDISTSSFTDRLLGEGLIRGHTHAPSRDGPAAVSRRSAAALSTSASSTDSVGGIAGRLGKSSRSGLPRSKYESGSVRNPSILSPSDDPSHLHKTNPAYSTTASNSGTPVPFFSTKRDSYFPEGVIAEGDASGASADLARILRRDSTSNPQTATSSISWGSLISNVSGLWAKKPGPPPETHEATISSLRDRRRHAPQTSPIQDLHSNHLERMVDEATHLPTTALQNERDGGSGETWRPSTPTDAQPPRLRVDDKDGVVDVDVNIPGFIGWEENKDASVASSFRRHSPYHPSTDDATSSYSSRSNRLYSNKSLSTTNVAGYLRRYHEDFILQGVKPYSELQEEIKQSMSQEITPVDDIYGPFPEKEANGELWVNVCTTLLADLRTFTIQRLTLKRKVPSVQSTETHHSVNPVPRPVEVPNDLGPSRQRKPPGLAKEDSERFLVETVMDFDTTLTDAIERVLSEAETPGKAVASPRQAHSRTVSVGTTSSVKSAPLEIVTSGKGRHWPPLSTLSQSDCRQAVVGALEEVVKSVNDDLAKHQRAQDVDGHVKIDDQTASQEMKQDNVLREGVKRWLLNVETRSVW